MVKRMDTGCWEQNRKPNDRWNQELRERQGRRERERKSLEGEEWLYSWIFCSWSEWGIRDYLFQQNITGKYPL